MARLPTPGGDDGKWGDILNAYLAQSHTSDGSLKDNTVGSSQLKDNAVTADHIATGAITKADVGLSSVDNTADADKPVSTAQQTALDAKADTAALAGKLNTADLDSQTAAKINDNASATATALTASIASQTVAPGARRIGGAGDSITAGTGASSQQNAYLAQAAVVAGTARATIKTNGGVGGETSGQVLARVPSILASGIDHLHVQVGTNDAGQEVPLTTFQGNVTSIVNLAKAAGVSVSIGLVPPRGSSSSSAIQALIRAYNLWLRVWTPRQGVSLADTFTPLADPATGYIAAAADADGVHPNGEGHKRMALAVGPALVNRHYAIPSPALSGADPFGLVANPLMTSTAGWFAANTPAHGTASLTLDPAEPGDLDAATNWLRVRLNNTAGSGLGNAVYGITLPSSLYSAGDVIAAWFRIAGTGGGGKLAASNNSVSFANLYDFTGSLIEAPGPMLARFTIPASPGSLRFDLSVSAAAGTDHSVWLSEFQAFNLTRMGVANAYA